MSLTPLFYSTVLMKPPITKQKTKHVGEILCKLKHCFINETTLYQTKTCMRGII